MRYFTDFSIYIKILFIILNFEKYITDDNDKKLISNITKEMSNEEKMFKNIKKPDYIQIKAHNEKMKELQLKKTEIIFKLQKELDIKHYRYFLPKDYELYVLVRKDIYEAEK